jgi:hypothetical protein
MVIALRGSGERPVFTMAEGDAMAWAITTLPPVSLTRRGIRRLRKAGIAPPSDLASDQRNLPTFDH